MALMQPATGAVTLVVLLALGLLARFWPHAPRAGDGLLFAADARLRALPRFRAMARRALRVSAAELAALAVAATGMGLTLAQPAVRDDDAAERRSRDVVLCLDVSGSMTDTVDSVLRAFADLSSELSGDRIALVMFDSSAVTVFPLTDDDVYVADQLAAARESIATGDVPGTRLGDVGSSLIGDGLAACLQRFDPDDAERSRTVVLATDNQAAGDPLFTLTDAVVMAESADVLVFGIAPSDNALPATSALESAVLPTGGQVLLLGPDSPLERITDAVSASQRRAVRGPERASTHDLVWPGAALTILALCAATIVSMTGGGRQREPRIWVRLAAAWLLIAVIVRPGSPPAGGPSPVTEVDVLVVLDRTTSMAARDFAGGSTRMDGAADDIDALIHALPNARYCVVTSDSTARVAVPWTTDTAAVATFARTTGWLEEGFGTGSDIAAAVPLATDILGSDHSARPDATRYVVYLGDGEQISPAEPASFAPVAELTDDALVLGYGTDAGGVMAVRPGSEELVSRDGTPQVSRVDEARLRTIADQAGGHYEHRVGGDAPAFWEDPAASTVPARDLPRTRPLWWWLALGAAAFLGVDVAWTSRRTRILRDEVRP